MKTKIIMHINYCEQGQSLEDACRKAVEWGFDGIEFRSRKNLAAVEPPTREENERYLDEVGAAVTKAGLREVIFGAPGPNLVLSDPAQREAQVCAYADFCEKAVDRFKVKVFNTLTGTLKNPDPSISYLHYPSHGSAIADDRLWQQAVEGFRPLAALAEKKGFVFGFETHGVYLHDLSKATRQLVDRIGSPAVGATFDYGTMNLFPKPPPLDEAIQTLAGKIFYLHIKNATRASDGSWTMVPLSDGAINHRRLLPLVKAAGFTGPICVEAPREGDREHYARQDLAYLRSLLRDLGWS